MYMYMYSVLDMGGTQPDNALQSVPAQLPPLKTKRHVQKELNDTDIVLHIGDISYARGYAYNLAVL